MLTVTFRLLFKGPNMVSRHYGRSVLIENESIFNISPITPTITKYYEFQSQSLYLANLHIMCVENICFMIYPLGNVNVFNMKNDMEM